MPFGAMGGLLGEIKMSFQLVMEQLYSALLVFSKYLSQVQHIFLIFMEKSMTCCCNSFIIRKRYILCKIIIIKAAQRFCVPVEEYYEFTQKLDCLHKPMKPAHHLQKKPILSSYKLCLAALYRNMDRFNFA